MADLIQEIAEDAAAEFGLTMGTDCFYEHEPDTDEDPVASFIGTGGPTERLDRAFQERTLQVRVLGGQPAALILSTAIYNLYHGGSNWTLPNWHVHWSEGIQPPYTLGRQDKNRELYVFNLLLRVREV